jgi:hypothetical protein
LVYFKALWYTFRPFGIFFQLVCCTKKNLATLSEALLSPVDTNNAFLSRDATRPKLDSIFISVLHAGLTDGMFGYQKFQFGYVLKGLGMENVCILYMGHLVYLHPFGIFCYHLVHM